MKLLQGRDAAPLHIPASALIFNQSGLRVATVTPDDRILFKAVTIARDLGREIELASGVTADDRIVTAPPDGLADGDQVGVIAGPKAGKPATASEKQDVKGQHSTCLHPRRDLTSRVADGGTAGGAGQVSARSGCLLLKFADLRSMFGGGPLGVRAVSF